MNPGDLSAVEKEFIRRSDRKEFNARVRYITVENFPRLGMLTSLRFLEWVAANPEGVVSLPTGKTPEYFIRWTKYFLDNWNDARCTELRKEYGLGIKRRPVLNGLHFVQIDEFYPISPVQHNSFYHYVQRFYMEEYGLDPDKACLINADEIPLAGSRKYREVFPQNKVDLSLRYRECESDLEKIQQESVFMIDNWCSEYEDRIREMGGIGFFLGGIGPDGHIAFNTRGSDHHSHTRLTSTNFETQAVAAADLGGIEISRYRLVITIGLETITYNPDAVAIIIAAGESKADVVKQSLESPETNLYPATALRKLSGSRFFLTRGAASKLEDSIRKYYLKEDWAFEKTSRSVIDLCKKINKFGNRINIDDLREDPYCRRVPKLSEEIVDRVRQSVEEKIARGLREEKNQLFLHTGPHHDDIMLGMLPFISGHLRSSSNRFCFAVMTSGFTAVTNNFMQDILQKTKDLFDRGLIEMTAYPDFFDQGYKYKWDKDVYHYLDKVASGDREGMQRGLSHRVVRALVEIFSVRDRDELRDQINELLSILRKSYEGERNQSSVQRLKGMIREFEEELVWAHFGVQVKNIRHLRLGFYTGDIFTEEPEKSRDVEPILGLLRSLNPTVLSLAFDPEGSGPDTHYKVLQAIAEALRIRAGETDLSGMRIWGYRNVWYRFHPSEVEIIAPASLNSLSVLNESFKNCYITQVDASFPSYQHDGPFSSLSRKIMVEQMKDLQFLLGKDYFYQNEHPRIRAAHGMVYVREMEPGEFMQYARKLREDMEG